MGAHLITDFDSMVVLLDQLIVSYPIWRLHHLTKEQVLPCGLKIVDVSFRLEKYRRRHKLPSEELTMQHWEAMMLSNYVDEEVVETLTDVEV